MRYIIVPDGVVEHTPTNATNHLRPAWGMNSMWHKVNKLKPGQVAHDPITGKSIVVLEDKSIELS